MSSLLAVAIDSYGVGALMIVGSTLASVAGLLMVRRLVDSRHLVASHDVGASLLSVVGTLYAVILGLIVVDSMTRFQEAQTVTDDETNALGDLIILAQRYPEAKRAEIHRLAGSYAQLVRTEEWPMMSRGRSSPRAHRAALDLLAAVADDEPVTESQKAVYAAALEAGSSLWNNRRTRTSMVSRGIPALEWLVLLVGGLITIGFTYFFAVERLWVQVIMTAMVAMIISLNLYLVAMFGYPYSGDLKVSPSGFKVEAMIRPSVLPPTQSPTGAH